MNTDYPNKQIDVATVVSIAIVAGQKILEFYRRNVEVSLKNNNTPVTLADTASEEIIAHRLKRLTPDIPIISEEVTPASFSRRKQWDCFWLVDPLDGTKEFIKGKDEFTVNIALVCQNVPVLGVIVAPALQEVYFAQKGKGAFRREGDQEKELLVRTTEQGSLIVVRSRSHQRPHEEDVMRAFGEVTEIARGSSLKFCQVAAGKADIYFRMGPTMEWDTAAGHCIAQVAGAQIVSLQRQPFLYNKENLKNSGFFCYGRGERTKEAVFSALTNLHK